MMRPNAVYCYDIINNATHMLTAVQMGVFRYVVMFPLSDNNRMVRGLMGAACLVYSAQTYYTYKPYTKLWYSSVTLFDVLDQAHSDSVFSSVIASLVCALSAACASDTSLGQGHWALRAFSGIFGISVFAAQWFLYRPQNFNLGLIFLFIIMQNLGLSASIAYASYRYIESDALVLSLFFLNLERCSRARCNHYSASCLSRDQDHVLLWRCSYWWPLDIATGVGVAYTSARMVDDLLIPKGYEALSCTLVVMLSVLGVVCFCPFLLVLNSIQSGDAKRVRFGYGAFVSQQARVTSEDVPPDVTSGS